MWVVKEDGSSHVYGTQRRPSWPELSKRTRVLVRLEGLVSIGMEFGFILQ